MTPERWSKISEIVANALELPSSHRAEYIRQACQDDAELIPEVQRLVEASDSTELHTPEPDIPDENSVWPQLSPGALVGARYRILRFVAHGGMGEVYEAEDKYGGRVALKTIRREIAWDRSSVQRFQREVQLNKLVTHPNVCRIYDLHWHTPGGNDPRAPQDQFLFLTMEFLEGETLSQRIKTQGRFNPAEALPIIRQLAEGLDAAHTKGVIHRDFKSGNVILTRSAEHPDQMHPVITDFGLARSISHHDRSASGSAMIGTPDYMAPEQIEKGEVSTASDLYALGVVVYEMLTGAKPYASSNSTASELDRFRRGLIPCRKRVPGIPRHWDDAILRALAIDPAQRFARASEFVEALQKPKIFSPVVSALKKRYLAVAAIILAALAGLFITRTHGKSTAAPSIALAGFFNASSPRLPDLSPALVSVLSETLHYGGDLRVVPHESMLRLQQDIGLKYAQELSADTLKKIRANVEADLVIAGTYMVAGSDSISLSVTVQDTVRAQTIDSFEVHGKENALNELAYSAGVKLRQILRRNPLSAQARQSLLASLPSTMAAWQLYSQALEQLRLYNYSAAADLLQQTTKADPEFAPAHAALADVWSTLEFEQKARDEAEQAYRYASNLSEEEQLVIEARYWELAKKDTKRETDVYRELFAKYPNKLDYGLRLAELQETKGAFETIRQLRALPKPQSDDPRIDVVEADNRAFLGDYRAAVDLAARAVQKCLARGERHVAAQALFTEGYAFLHLGDEGRSRSALEEAETICSALRDLGGVGQAKRQIAVLLQRRGDLSGSLTMLNTVLTTCNELGSKACAMRVQRRIANIYSNLGRLSEAVKLNESALQFYREEQDQELIATQLNNIGDIWILQGRLEEAKRNFEESLQIFRELQSKHGMTWPLLGLAKLYFETGQLAEATARAQEALEIARQISNPDRISEALGGLAGVSFEQGDFHKAGNLYQQAIDTQTKAGENVGVAQSRLDLAAVQLAQGLDDEAALMGKQAEEQFRSAHMQGETAMAEALRAVAALRRNQKREACEIFADIGPRTANGEDRLMYSSIVVAVVPVEAACNGTKKALNRLAQTMTETKRTGFTRLAMEAEMEYECIQEANGSMESKARIDALRNQAKQAGYIRISKSCPIADSSAKNSERRR